MMEIIDAKKCMPYFSHKQIGKLVFNLHFIDTSTLKCWYRRDLCVVVSIDFVQAVLPISISIFDFLLKHGLQKLIVTFPVLVTCFRTVNLFSEKTKIPDYLKLCFNRLVRQGHCPTSLNRCFKKQFRNTFQELGLAKLVLLVIDHLSSNYPITLLTRIVKQSKLPLKTASLRHLMKTYGLLSQPMRQVHLLILTDSQSVIEDNQVLEHCLLHRSFVLVKSFLFLNTMRNIRL